MSSSHSYATSATSEHGLPCVLNDHPIQEGRLQSSRNPPTYCVRAAGILRYNRESDHQQTNLTPILLVPPIMTEYALKCDYCGEAPTPFLDPATLAETETAPHFCCAQRQQLCQMLLNHWRDLKTGTPSSVEDESASEMEELKGREMEDYRKSMMDLSSGLRKQSGWRICENDSIRPPLSKFCVLRAEALSFRLSCPPGKGCWIMCPASATERSLITKSEEAQVLVPICDHKPLQFGICYHQDRAQFLQKYYSSGMKFLTMFPDGSAQVLYPSGHLAITVVVTEDKGRVCFVFDHHDARGQLIRAVFQSDGRAACYHSNGNIWLSLNSSGGQCLNEAGVRVRQWSWSRVSLPATPLHPLFLPLNKAVGVRVFGRERVFVSFLAEGRQAKLSVGICCAQCAAKADEHASRPSAMTNGTQN